MSNNTLKARILAFGKTVSKMVAAVQELAIECVIHALKHGDVTVADLLVDTCGKGVKTSALRAWFVATGAFADVDGRFQLDKKGAAELRKMTDADLLAMLEGMAWVDAKPAKKVVASVDLSAELDRFISKMEKLIADPAIACDNVDLFESVKTATMRLQAIAILRGTSAVEGVELVQASKDARDNAEGVAQTMAERKAADRHLMHLQRA